MGDITFEFSVEKLINAIALFSQRGIADLTKLKVAKLLYFADKQHLLNYGTPILGDVYFCMQFGPVPSFALNEMNEAILRSEVAGESESDYNVMNRMLRVRRGWFHYPRFEAKQGFDPNVFSESEITVLSNVAQEYGCKTAKELVNLTHREPTWTVANEDRTPGGRTPIPYELFFEGAPANAIKHLARLKAEFSGEAIPLPGDEGYRVFANALSSYDFEPSMDLDSEELKHRGITHSA